MTVVRCCDRLIVYVFVCQVVLQLQRQDYLAARAEMSIEDLAAEKRRERRATMATLAVVPHIQVRLLVHFFIL